MNVKNIFEIPPPDLEEEFIESLIENEKFVLERIISAGHSSPEDFWYDQDKNEFVILLKGEAELSFENGETVLLKPGDHLIIPAHKKHRVNRTSPSEKTYWLALHY